jgi:NitT/TauT family transport system substrate-binding protein
MVSPKLAKEKPEAVKGLVRAINRAMREVLAEPDAGIDLLAKKEPLISKAIEKQRLAYVTRTLIATPEAVELGVGDVSDGRMNEAIDAIVAAFELPKKPTANDVFSRAFLPPRSERAFAKAGN